MTQMTRRGGLAELLLGSPEPGPWHAQIRRLVRDPAYAAGYAACALAFVMLALLVCWLAIVAAIRVPGLI
jgi:hypothetical protein